MKKDKVFFRPYNMHGLVGYHIPVRNSFSNKLELEYLPAEARELYEQKFGTNVLSDEEFINWYSEIAKDVS